MKFIKVIFALILFVTPIGLHIVDATDTTYMMTPLGAVSKTDNELEFAFYSFKWYSEDGRWDYLQDGITDDTKTFAILYISDIEISILNIDNNLSTEGLLTIILPYLLILYLILILIPGGVGSLIADIFLIGGSVMGFVSYFSFINRYGDWYDANIPVFAIVSLIFAIIGLFISIRTMKVRRHKKRKHTRRRR
ncbi:MAG: hypothetical protein ACTSQE_08425 [Candidatus Heimdallarchaeaceae archaeon]